MLPVRTLKLREGKPLVKFTKTYSDWQDLKSDPSASSGLESQRIQTIYSTDSVTGDQHW